MGKHAAAESTSNGLAEVVVAHTLDASKAIGAFLVAAVTAGLGSAIQQVGTINILALTTQQAQEAALQGLGTAFLVGVGTWAIPRLSAKLDALKARQAGAPAADGDGAAQG